MNIQHTLSLKDLSTFGVGGPLQILVTVSTPEELIEAVRTYPTYRVFAGGSNIIFPDEGMDGLIRYQSTTIEVHDEHISVHAGHILMDLISAAIQNGLAGIETLSGIPGTIGGAVVGNAGAYGQSIAQSVETVTAWDGTNTIALSQEECHFSYRHSIFKEKPLIVLSVVLKLHKGDEKLLSETSTDIVHIREKKYKPGIKCPGSFFKNILASECSDEILSRIDTAKIVSGKIPAGYLLTEVGARGIQVGDIEVADFHGNLLINKGNGTSAQVKELARILKEKVHDKFGITLEEEVRYF